MRAINATTNSNQHDGASTYMPRDGAGELAKIRSSANINEQSPFVFMSEVARDCDVTSRAVRKWIAKGRFPNVEGNLHGRCFWRRETYLAWQMKAMSGCFAKSSNLFS
jgi:hypothetical protein